MFVSVFEQLCERNGITPTAMLRELGIKSSNYTYWKQNNSYPRQKVLEKIAEYFGVSVGYLMGYETGRDDFRPDPDMEEADEEELPDEVQQLLDEIRRDPARRMLFSVTKGASTEDILAAVQIIQILKQRSEGNG